MEQPNEELKQSPEIKAKLGFGTMNAIKGPTPKAIVFTYRVLMFLSGVWILIEPQFHVPQKISYSIAKWTVLGINIIYFSCQFFGWVKPTVPSETTQV